MLKLLEKNILTSPEGYVLSICLAGLVLRLVYFFFASPDTLFPDEERFLTTASNIIIDGEMSWEGRYAWDMPFLPFLSAFVLFLFDGRVYALQLSLIGISSLTILVVAYAVKHISRSNSAMIIAAFGVAFYPFFIFFSSRILTETLFLFFLSLVLLNLYRPQSTVAFSVMAALAHLTRPTLLFFLPLIWFWQIAIKKLKIRQVFLSILVFFFIINFWGVRNYLVLGEYFLTTASSGHVLIEGNNPWNNTGGPSGSFDHAKIFKNSLPEGDNEIRVDRLKTSRALTYIFENPRQTFDVALKKFFRLWSLLPNDAHYRTTFLSTISFATTFPIFVLAGLSPWILRQKFRKLNILYALIAYYTAIHVITLGSIRYRIPIDLVLIILSSMTFSEILKKSWPQKEDKLSK